MFAQEHTPKLPERVGRIVESSEDRLPVVDRQREHERIAVLRDLEPEREKLETLRAALPAVEQRVLAEQEKKHGGELRKAATDLGNALTAGFSASKRALDAGRTYENTLLEVDRQRGFVDTARDHYTAVLGTREFAWPA